MMSLTLNKERAMEVKYFVGGVDAKINKYRGCIELFATGRKEYSDVQFLVATIFEVDGKPHITARSNRGNAKEYKTIRGLVNFLSVEFGSCLERDKLERMFKLELREIIEMTKAEQEKEMERKIKERTATAGVLREEILLESEGRFSLQNFDDIKGCGDVIFDGKTNIMFDIDDNLEIAITGGDRIAYGEWYDLELEDEHLIECGKKLQEVLYKIKDKNIKLHHDNVYRVYPREADLIIEERKIKGKFYLKDVKGWVGIDNEDGDAWTEDFESLKECIDWLIGESEKDYSCSCGENDGEYTVNIHIEFNNGEEYDELIGMCCEEETIQHIKELIEENGWEEEVKDYSYGYFCPYCLESLE